MASSPCELVFPDAQGRMRSGESDPAEVLRRAMGRAGLVNGYNFICRRCKARKATPHSWKHSDPEERRCPTCSMRLWPKAIPRPMRFHDLRHSTATLLLRAKVPMQHVQRILRHADIKLTVDTYGHLVVEDLHDSIAALPPLVSTGSHPLSPDATPNVPLMSPASSGPKGEGLGSEDFSRETEAFRWSGRQDLNLRPLAPQASALPGCATPRHA
jgi:integrase